MKRVDPRAASTEELSLEELAEETATLLAAQGLLAVQADRRVSAAPDGRTVRYYTTLGLLDPPTLVGRQARYRRRHVLQLAAIKALQASRLSLGEVQRRLYGRSDDELAALLAAAAARVRQPAEAAAPSIVTAPATTWRRVVLEPGLELVVAADWQPGASQQSLLDRIRGALDALAAVPQPAAEEEAP